MGLVKVVYSLTGHFPKSEIYGLISQMRRAVISIPSNIAEGQQRKNTKEFLQFLRVSLGSCAELETQLIIAFDLYPRYNDSGATHLLSEIQKMLRAIITKLESRSSDH